MNAKRAKCIRKAVLRLFENNPNFPMDKRRKMYQRTKRTINLERMTMCEIRGMFA